MPRCCVADCLSSEAPEEVAAPAVPSTEAAICGIFRFLWCSPTFGNGLLSSSPSFPKSALRSNEGNVQTLSESVIASDKHSANS